MSCGPHWPAGSTSIRPPRRKSDVASRSRRAAGPSPRGHAGADGSPNSADLLAAAKWPGWFPTLAVAGIADVLEALAEQRVATLLLAGEFHAAGAQLLAATGCCCPLSVSECPADGTATGPVADLREPMIAAAVRQDATVLVVSPKPDERRPRLRTARRSERCCGSNLSPLGSCKSDVSLDVSVCSGMTGPPFGGSSATRTVSIFS